MAYTDCRECGWPLGCSYCDPEPPCVVCTLVDLIEGVADAHDVAVGMIAAQDNFADRTLAVYARIVEPPKWHRRLKQALGSVQKSVD